MNPRPANFDVQLAAALDETADELYEMAPCGFLTTTIDGRIVKVNRTLIEWLGYERADLLDGKRFVDLLTIGGRIFYETHFNLLLRMQTAVDEIALDIICKDGRVLPALINARQKRSTDGEPLLNRFTVFNSRDRRKYERGLLVARDLFQTTLNSIGDGVVATDVDGRVTFLNPVAEELSGWKNDEAFGKPIDEVLVLRRENSSEPVENPITRSLREGVIVGMANHTVLISKSGRQIPIDDSASPIRDANGKLTGGVLVFRDISAQRRAEEALQKTHDELRRSNEDLSQFAHVASHDLRSPLNTVFQFAQLLELNHGEQLGEGKELLLFLRDAADRMRKLIDDLLSYASVSAENPVAVSPVDANIHVRMAIDNLQGAIKESSAVITYDVLPTVRVSATHVGQLFQNLIGNAIHYRSADAPRIHISAIERAEEWLFSCQDNGVGIDPDYHTLVFAAFKRLHGADRPGSGIGLAVCKKIVDRYGGRIWVESEAGKGSTFFFTFPKIV